MAKKNNLSFAITEITEISSYLNSTKSLGIDEIDINNVAFTQMFNINFHENTGTFEIKIAIDFRYILSDSNFKELFGITIGVKFHFVDWEGIIKVVDDTIDMPDELAINLLSIAYSSTRGFLAAKTSNTEYTKFVLPLINPKEFEKLVVTKTINKKK